MFRTRFSIFFLMTMTISILQAAELPKIIDFGKFQSMGDPHFRHSEMQWEIGCYAFNLAPEITPFFAYLQREYQVGIAVETGTCNGNTSLALARLFDEVYTIEIVESLYNEMNTKFSRYPNIKCLLGSSEKVLKDLLPSLAGERALFYLDAHWESFWPLLDELEEISKTHHDNCIIVIDDFKVPGRKDIFYDAYGNAECSLEYVKGKLDRVFSSYTYHFLIPKSTLSRAKLIVIPKAWNEE